METRKAQKKDISACLIIAGQENEKYWNKKDFHQSIKSQSAIFLVAEENKKIIGYVIGFITPTKPTEAMIHQTKIDKNQRKRRIGTELVNNFCQKAFQKGAKIVYALIEPELKKFYINSCRFKKSGHWLEVSKKN